LLLPPWPPPRSAPRQLRRLTRGSLGTDRSSPGIALHSVEANQRVVTTVTLPSGETFDLRHPSGAF
jgi:hypothetical protein